MGTGATTPKPTGAGLPAPVRSLTIIAASGTYLVQPVSISRELRYVSNRLNTNGQAPKLLSNAGGPAFIVSEGGVVKGPVTIQRYIDPGLNPSTTAYLGGKGYRHFSLPMCSSTVADLTTSGFTPVLTQGYNTSATPGTTTPSAPLADPAEVLLYGVAFAFKRLRTRRRQASLSYPAAKPPRPGGRGGFCVVAAVLLMHSCVISFT